MSLHHQADSVGHILSLEIVIDLMNDDANDHLGGP